MLTRLPRRLSIATAAAAAAIGLAAVGAPAYADDLLPDVGDALGSTVTGVVDDVDLPIPTPPVTTPPVTTPEVTTPVVTVPPVTVPPGTVPPVTVPPVTVPPVTTAPVTVPPVTLPSSPSVPTGTGSVDDPADAGQSVLAPSTRAGAPAVLATSEWATAPSSDRATVSRRVASPSGESSEPLLGTSTLGRTLFDAATGASAREGIEAGAAPVRTVMSNEVGVAMLAGLGVVLLLVIGTRLLILRRRA